MALLEAAEYKSFVFFSGFMSGIASALEKQRIIDGKET